MSEGEEGGGEIERKRARNNCANGERSEKIARARLIAEGRLTCSFSIRECLMYAKKRYGGKFSEKRRPAAKRPAGRFPMFRAASFP